MGSDESDYKGYSVVNLPSKMRNKSEEVSSGLFEDVATYLIVFTHSCVEKMTSLPFPVGTIVETVEQLVVPLARPVEGFTLRVLAAVDGQILTVGSSIEGCILCLRTRGLIGMSADLWVQHEASVREKLQAMMDLANKVPLIGLITPLVRAISAPLGNAVSDWLVEHSQSHVKRIQFYDKETEKGKEEQKEEPGDWLTDESDIVEVAEDMKEEIEPTDTTLKMDAEEPTAAGEAETGVPELLVENLMVHDEKENDAKDVSAVLELIDSGWLMGSAAGAASPSPKVSVAAVHRTSVATPPKTAATATHQTSSTPKKPVSLKSRRGILRQ